jgi:hypothetical protein
MIRAGDAHASTDAAFTGGGQLQTIDSATAMAAVRIVC